MVELRWLVRKIDYTGVNQGHMPDTERVLQFRRENRFSTDEGYVTMWSPWADVPVVDESASGEG